MSKLPIYAHRGYTKFSRENSLNAMKAAMENGATGIEFDLQLTKDRIAIVTHDLNLKSITGKSINTNEITLNNLRKMKIKGDSKPILTFSELLEWAIPNKIPMNIELKESFQGRNDDLEIIVKKVKNATNIHFSSFHEDVLYSIKKMNANAEVAFIPTRKFNWDHLSEMPWLDTLHVNKRFYYKERYLQKASETHKSIRVYGVVGNEKYLSDPHESVVGWITDEPNRIAQAQSQN